MKLNPAWILGRGVIYHDQYSCFTVPYPAYSLVVRALFMPISRAVPAEGCRAALAWVSRAAPEGGLGPRAPLSKIGHPIFNADADPAWILARGGYLSRLIFIFTVPYPAYSLVVRALFMPISRAVPAGGCSDGSDPPYFVGLSSPDPRADSHHECRCRPPQGVSLPSQ